MGCGATGSSRRGDGHSADRYQRPDHAESRCRDPAAGAASADVSAFRLSGKCQSKVERVLAIARSTDLAAAKSTPRAGSRPPPSSRRRGTSAETNAEGHMIALKADEGNPEHQNGTASWDTARQRDGPIAPGPVRSPNGEGGGIEVNPAKPPLDA